jgi:hypothetical protein
VVLLVINGEMHVTVEVENIAEVMILCFQFTSTGSVIFRFLETSSSVCMFDHTFSVCGNRLWSTAKEYVH